MPIEVNNVDHGRTCTVEEAKAMLQLAPVATILALLSLRCLLAHIGLQGITSKCPSLSSQALYGLTAALSLGRPTTQHIDAQTASASIASTRLPAVKPDGYRLARTLANGKTVDLTGDMEMSSAFSDLLALRQVLADAIAREAQVKQRIQQRMGEATTARFDAGEVRWKRSKDSAAVDVDHLLMDQPELASTYRVPRPGSRRFTVKVHESLTLAAPSSAADE